MRIGASDGTMIPGEAAGDVSAPAARHAVAAARLHVIAANALIIIVLIDGGAGEQPEGARVDRFDVL